MVHDPKTVELDVRPHLRKKLEPFQMIMDAVKTLSKEDTFILHAIFKPTPLLGLMKTKGFVNKVEQIHADHWIVTFMHKSRKHDMEPAIEQTTFMVESAAPSRQTVQTHELDNRGLVPPQPMVRTLKKLEEAHSGDTVVIHNDRVPMFLIEELNALEYPYQVEEQPDGSAKVYIRKK